MSNMTFSFLFTRKDLQNRIYGQRVIPRMPIGLEFRCWGDYGPRKSLGNSPYESPINVNADIFHVRSCNIFCEA